MQIQLAPLCAVYAAFLLKHFLCDYPLQTGWMVRGKAAATGWRLPLAAHAATHAAFTLVIALATVPGLFWLSLCDFLVHAAVDRFKALATRRLSPERPLFWWALGLDQAVHQATHFCFVLLLVTRL